MTVCGHDRRRRGCGSLRVAMLLGLIALAGVLAAPAAQAQGYGTGAPADNEAWTFQAGAYLFATGVQGDVGVQALSLEADTSFSDILENLDSGFMGFAEADYDKFGFLVDAAYLDLEDSASRVSTRGFVQATVDTTFKQTVLGGYATYTVLEDTINANSKVRDFNLDVVGGARYNRLENDLGLTVAGLIQSRTDSRNRTVDWVDPVIGLRATYVPLENWFVSGWLDYGGFGVGAQNTWQVIATVGYRFENGIDLFGAYRAYHFDYETGSGRSYLNLDLTYVGPEFGIAYRF